MATAQKKKPAEPSVITKLAEKGEETIHRLMDEAGRKQTLAEARHKASAAKSKLDSASRSALLQVGLAPADDVRELRQKIESLEARVAKLESGEKKAPARRKTA